MNAYDKVVKARGQMLNIAPFWATIALMLRLEQADDKCGTMATDGRRMIFNEKFVDGLTMEELQGVCAHEAAHVVFDHMLRRNDRDPVRWNIAGDYAINALIRETFKLPHAHLYNPDFEDMTVEEIYERLPEGAGGGKGGSGQGKGGRDNGNNPDPGGCGEVRDYEGEGEGGGEGEGKDGGSAAKLKGDIERLKRDIKIAISQAAQIQKGFGSLPAGIQKIIDTLKEPSVDWRELLRRFVTSSAKNDYTWRRPNRRLVAEDIYTPSLRSEDEVGGIVVAIDTSGSCWDEQIMTDFCAELNGILGCVRGDVRILYADTQIQKEVVFAETDRPVKLEAIGGGGTDFCAVFEHIAKLQTAPQCLIYLTDLEGRFPKDHPNYPVMWGLVGYYSENASERAPFGEVVPMGLNKRGW
jgi:predicted metal-dependent peptidase